MPIWATLCQRNAWDQILLSANARRQAHLGWGSGTLATCWSGAVVGECWLGEGPQIVCLTRQSNACISKSTWYASAKSALVCLSIHEKAKLDRFFHDSQAQAITLSIFFEAVEMRWGNGQQVIAITRGSRSQYLPILSGVCCSSSASVYYWWSLGILEIVFSSIEVDHFCLPSDHSSASLQSGL